MLYKNTEAAICELLSGSDKKHGPIRVIFDVDTLAVSASFRDEVATKELHLHPSEFFVDCELRQADETGIAVRAAAFNAVAGLSESVNIEKDKGEAPSMYGTMALPGGEVVPYDESVMSFVHEDCHINDPTLSECGRFTVDPVEAYGFERALREGQECLVRKLHNGELQISGPASQHFTEEDKRNSTLIRLDGNGTILAYARLDLIRTGEDYPDDIVELTTKAQPLESAHEGMTLVPTNYIIHGIPAEENRETIERAINAAINAGLEVAVEQEELNGGIAEGPAGDATRLDIGTPYLFHLDSNTGTGKLIIPTRPVGKIGEFDVMETLDWVLQQGEKRAKENNPDSPEAQLLSKISLGIVPEQQIDLADPEPAFGEHP